jgi:hypothetical protein
MAKGWKKWVVPAIVLLVIVGIILGVLGGLGYFKKKAAVVGPTGGYTTCIAPTITNVTYDGSGGMTVYFNPPLSETCITKFGKNSLELHATFYDGTGKQVLDTYGNIAQSPGTSVGFLTTPDAFQSPILGSLWSAVITVNIGALSSAPYTYRH